MNQTVARFHLSPGHVKPIWAGHPWVYAQAIGRREGSPSAGDVVEVVDSHGNLLGRGFYSEGSAIPVRLVSRQADEELDSRALERRILAALARRSRVLDLPNSETTGFRLIHSEGDDLPGLIVDRFDRTLVVQFSTFGMARRREELLDLLSALNGVDSVVEIANRSAQSLEGFESTTGTVRGAKVTSLRFRERGFDWDLPLEIAQKTGFYFDQRDNRQLIESIAEGRSVLDLCCYVGPFSLAAARGGASSVVAVDRSAALLSAAEKQARRNQLAERITYREADVRKDLATWAAEGERYDLVLLDPPKFSPTGKHRKRALSTYRNLNSAALRLLEPGGLFLTCSCSAAISPEDLLREVAAAGQRLRRSPRLLELRHQPSDHPTPAVFDEGRYLDVALFEVA